MTNLKKAFQQLFPDKIFLNNEEASLIENYLKNKGWIGQDTKILKLEKPGEGNMNFVIRVKTDKSGSLVLKQSRPWVEKYPQLAAPMERIVVEKTYYQTIRKYKTLAGYSPHMLHFDDQNLVMALQDLGETADFTNVYMKGIHFLQTEIVESVSYLNLLGKIRNIESYPDNKALKALNHQHIFHLPFITDNGFNLDEVQAGLMDVSIKAKTDKDLKSTIAHLGELYQSEGTILVHGDFYPGSLLKAGNSIKVIDPEFSFLGPEEWDISIFIAHLLMAETDEKFIRLAFEKFERKDSFNIKIFSGFVGVEILRRLIGLAQLPLEMGLEQKTSLIDRSIHWVKEGNIDVLD